MAIGIFFEGKGVSREQYNQVNSVVLPNNTLPAGMLSHVAGTTADGLVVVEVWESQEAANKFFQETLGSALAAANVVVAPTTFEIFNTLP